MGYITSVLIWYERIGKYHHNYVLFFCKDMDKTMNLMLFCWILVCFNMFLVNICKRCYYLTTDDSCYFSDYIQIKGEENLFFPLCSVYELLCNTVSSIIASCGFSHFQLYSCTFTAFPSYSTLLLACIGWSPAPLSAPTITMWNLRCWSIPL